MKGFSVFKQPARKEEKLAEKTVSCDNFVSNMEYLMAKAEREGKNQTEFLMNRLWRLSYECARIVLAEDGICLKLKSVKSNEELDVYEMSLRRKLMSFERFKY
jgi:hypothetical protein